MIEARIRGAMCAANRVFCFKKVYFILLTYINKEKK